MNRFLLLLSCLFLAAVALVKAEDPAFAGIPWLTPAEEVKKLMAAKGYVYVGTTKETADEFVRNSPLGKRRISDLDLVFVGEMFETKCRIEIAFNGSNQMVNVELSFEDENDHHRELMSTLSYDLGQQIFRQLESKYGKLEYETTEEIDPLGTVEKQHRWGKPKTPVVQIALDIKTQTIIYLEDGQVNKSKLIEVRVRYYHPLFRAEYQRRRDEREKNSKKDDL
jgi:hypothetical protein